MILVKRKGFTVIEAMVAVAIFGSLMFFAAQYLAMQRLDSAEKRLANDLSLISLALKRYAFDMATDLNHFPSTGTLAHTGVDWLKNSGSCASAASTNLFDGSTWSANVDYLGCPFGNLLPFNINVSNLNITAWTSTSATGSDVHLTFTVPAITDSSGKTRLDYTEQVLRYLREYDVEIPDVSATYSLTGGQISAEIIHGDSTRTYVTSSNPIDLVVKSLTVQQDPAFDPANNNPTCSQTVNNGLIKVDSNGDYWICTQDTQGNNIWGWQAVKFH